MRESPHQRMKDQNEIPLIAFDYARTKPGIKPILIAKCGKTGNVMMRKVDQKGYSEDAIFYMVKFVQQLGHVRIRLKDDPETAAVQLREAVTQELRKINVEVIPESSPVGSKQSNGMTERAVQMCMAQAKVS